jgi:uncharacterized protein (DUF58 family)
VRIGPLTIRRDLFRPRRTIRPTRDGWWCLGAALALGFAAMNTGNNLLYLLASLLLALIIVSGVLSEQSMRRLRLTAVVPEEIYAATPTALGVRVANRKRWLTSYSVMLETGERRLYVDRLRAGEERLQMWETAFARRGRQRLPGLRVITRFPFGLFVKTSRPMLDEEILVFPAVVPLTAARRRELAAGSARPQHRRGRGHDLYNLRDYRPGDDRRLIHWRSSARTGTLTVRETQAETASDVRITLLGGGRVSDRLEAGISEAASLATHLLGTGAAVELSGRGVHVPAGRGRAHARRLLTALALYDPNAALDVAPPGPRAVAEIEVDLG